MSPTYYRPGRVSCVGSFRPHNNMLNILLKLICSLPHSLAFMSSWQFGSIRNIYRYFFLSHRLESNLLFTRLFSLTSVRISNPLVTLFQMSLGMIFLEFLLRIAPQGFLLVLKLALIFFYSLANFRWKHNRLYWFIRASSAVIAHRFSFFGVYHHDNSDHNWTLSVTARNDCKPVLKDLCLCWQHKTVYSI